MQYSMLGVLEIIAITLVAAALAASAQYVFKKNLKKFRFDAAGIVSTLTHGKTLLGLLLYAVSLIAYLYALSSAPIVSFVYPIFSSSFIFILLISKYALKEEVSLHRSLGILLILVGIAIVSLTFPV